MSFGRNPPLVKASSRRTNSLGRAKADCHTCSILRKTCDRQRPQCGPCMNNSQKCGGYVMDLVWKDDRPHEALLTNGAIVGSSAAGVSLSDRPTGSERKFRFKQGRPIKRRKPPESDDTETNVPAAPRQRSMPLPSPLTTDKAMKTGTALPVVDDNAALLSIIGSVESSPATATDHQYQRYAIHGPPSSPLFKTYGKTHWLESTLQMDISAAYTPDSLAGDCLDPYDASSSISPDSTNGTHAPQSSCLSKITDDTISLSPLGVSYFDASASEDDHRIYHITETPLLPNVLYNDLSHKFGPVLAMYDQEFCVMPLTADCNANPFRIRREHCEGSRFLLHAILALSMQHLAKKEHNENLTHEMLVHRSTAIHLYSQALSISKSLALLDTLLIMVNLDATQSASGTWDVHLMGAYKLLESAGGVEVCRLSSRVRAQVAMLVWWDVTIAFISRQEPLFPLSHLEILLECDENDGWTFFTLNGCPGEFVLAMARLAKLASTYEKVASLEWATFNPLPIKAILQEVEDWKNADDSSHHDLEEFEDVGAKRDRFHCTEAWRNAIILYTLRVFSGRQIQSGLQSISYLTRIILDHIRCIRRDEVIQKQVLIPLFLAAAETDDETDRNFVRQYCKHWSSKSRYFMFETAEMLIERIWADWHIRQRDTYWWGLTVGGGSPSKHRQDNPMASQILLG